MRRGREGIRVEGVGFLREARKEAAVSSRVTAAMIALFVRVVSTRYLRAGLRHD